MAYPALQVAPNNVGGAFIGGMEQAQQIRARNMLMQQQQQTMDRDQQFRNVLAQSVGPMAASAAAPPGPPGAPGAAPPQGDPNAGAANYLMQGTQNPLGGPDQSQMQRLMALDPERALKFQQEFQAEQANAIAQQHALIVQQAQQRVHQAQFIIASKYPRRSLELGFPDVMQNLKDHGVDVDNLDDEGVRQIAQHVLEHSAPIAGMGPLNINGEGFTLGENQVRFDGQGKEIAAGPKKADLTAQNQMLEREQNLRKEFEGHIEGFQAIRSAYENVQNAKPNDAGDTQLVLNFMRTISPGIRIQPGERVDDAASVPGVPQQVIGVWNKLVGGGKLNDGQRQEIRDQARTTYRSQKQLAGEQRDRFSNLAKMAGVDSYKVVGDEDKPVKEFDVGGRQMFDSEGEAASAGLKDGTPIVVNGRKAVWHN